MRKGPERLAPYLLQPVLPIRSYFVLRNYAVRKAGRHQLASWAAVVGAQTCDQTRDGRERCRCWGRLGDR